MRSTGIIMSSRHIAAFCFKWCLFSCIPGWYDMVVMLQGTTSSIWCSAAVCSGGGSHAHRGIVYCSVTVGSRVSHI
jgi:hypothetical protein